MPSSSIVQSFLSSSLIDNCTSPVHIEAFCESGTAYCKIDLGSVQTDLATREIYTYVQYKVKVKTSCEAGAAQPVLEVNGVGVLGRSDLSWQQSKIVLAPRFALALPRGGNIPGNRISSHVGDVRDERERNGGRGSFAYVPTRIAAGG